jgi:drug/metabolite transporter (DMT)-like permease
MATWRDYLKLHLVVFLWGTTAVMAKLITIPAIEMLFHRTWMAAVGLFIFAWFTKKSLNISVSSVLKILGVGIIVGVHWIAFFYGGQISTASLSLVGFATCSLWTAILEPIVNRKSIRPLEVMLGLLVFAGLYIIFRFEIRFFNGFLLSVLSGFLAAVFSIMNERLVRKHSATSIAFYEMAGAFLGVLIFLPFYKLYFAEGMQLNLRPAPADWFYLFILSVVCSVFAFTMAVNLMKKLSVFTVQLTLNLEPIYGITLAIFVLNEQKYMTPSFLSGTALIMLAVLSYPALKKKLS